MSLLESYPSLHLNTFLEHGGKNVWGRELKVSLFKKYWNKKFNDTFRNVNKTPCFPMKCSPVFQDSERIGGWSPPSRTQLGSQAIRQYCRGLCNIRQRSVTNRVIFRAAFPGKIWDLTKFSREILEFLFKYPSNNDTFNPPTPPTENA